MIAGLGLMSGSFGCPQQGLGKSPKYYAYPASANFCPEASAGHVSGVDLLGTPNTATAIRQMMSHPAARKKHKRRHYHPPPRQLFPACRAKKGLPL